MAWKARKQSSDEPNVGGVYLPAGLLTLIGVGVVYAGIQELAAGPIDWKAICMKGIGASVFGGAGIVLFFVTRAGVRFGSREAELKLYAGRHLRDKSEAEWLATQMRECLELRGQPSDNSQPLPTPSTADNNY